MVIFHHIIVTLWDLGNSQLYWICPSKNGGSFHIFYSYGKSLPKMKWSNGQIQVCGVTSGSCDASSPGGRLVSVLFERWLCQKKPWQFPESTTGVRAKSLLSKNISEGMRQYIRAAPFSDTPRLTLFTKNAKMLNPHAWIRWTHSKKKTLKSFGLILADRCRSRIPPQMEMGQVT